MYPNLNLPELALSIRQPWAHAIIGLGKNIENRNWPTKHRGRICIHAAKGMTKDELEDFNDFAGRIAEGFQGLQREDMDFGAIVGTAEIDDCVRCHSSPWFFGKFGFVLSNMQPIPPVPVRRHLGFFHWRKNIIDDLPVEEIAPALPLLERALTETDKAGGE